MPFCVLAVSKLIHFEEVIIISSCNDILYYFHVKTCCSTLIVFVHGLCYFVLFSLNIINVYYRRTNAHLRNAGYGVRVSVNTTSVAFL